MGALDAAVRQGKALYVGISSYNSRRTKEAAAILKRLGTPCLIHQPSYSMVNRWIEDDGLLDTLEAEGIGAIVFSPLAQGMLTDKYLNGVPSDSRAASARSFDPKMLTPENLERVRQLERDRQAARPVARPDGARLGVARQAGDVGADRREPPGAGRRRRRGARQARLHRRGTRRRSTATRSRAGSISGRGRRSSAGKAPLPSGAGQGWDTPREHETMTSERTEFSANCASSRRAPRTFFGVACAGRGLTARNSADKSRSIDTS